MKTLELKDICGYLPFGLMQKHYDEISSLTLATRSDTGKDVFHELPIKFGKPILRPMSDLTKEITHKGETFVPLVELAKLSINWVKTLWEVSDNGLFVYGLYGCSSDIIKFYYRPRCFYVSEPNAAERDNDQAILFDKLAEWMFDYRGLIPAGLALDVNTLPENPYE